MKQIFYLSSHSLATFFCEFTIIFALSKFALRQKISLIFHKYSKICTYFLSGNFLTFDATILIELLQLGVINL